MINIFTPLSADNVIIMIPQSQKFSKGGESKNILRLALQLCQSVGENFMKRSEPPHKLHHIYVMIGYRQNITA